MSSYISTIAYWIFSVVCPLGLSCGMGLYLVLNRPNDWAGGVFMSLVIGSFGAACLFLGRTFSLRVFIYPKEGLIVAGKRRRAISGNERVQITRLPGLHYFVITFSDGETIKFLPQYPIYKQMTSSGAEAFWEKLVNVKES